MGIYGIELNNSLTTNGVDKMKHTETRMKKAENWSANDFLEWYPQSSGDMHITEDYLWGMKDKELKRLKIIAEDILYDLARNEKRRISTEQLFEGETLSIW